MSFDFIFPSCEPVTPPSYTFDPSFFQAPPYNPGHARSSSYGSFCSTVESSPSDSASTRTRMTTPSRTPPPPRQPSAQPVRQHGPILLPKIRSQDQAIESPAKRVKTSPAPAPKPRRRQTQGAFRPAHARSFTNPETLNSFASNAFAFAPAEDQHNLSQSLLCSPVTFAQDSGCNASMDNGINTHSRRASTVSLDGASLERYGFPTYLQMPSYISAIPEQQQQQPQQNEAFMFGGSLNHNSHSHSQSHSFAPRAPSPLSLASTPAMTPEPTPTTTLLEYLTAANPAPALVRTISFPLRDPHTRHFWWDVRQVRSWTSFNLDAVLSRSDASALLRCPVPQPLLPPPAGTGALRHPETEGALHAIYASHYLPRLNAALALSSQRPMQLSVPSLSAKTGGPSSGGLSAGDHAFVANVAGESSAAAAMATMFGAKPTARVVGLVKSFDRFNTGMRVEGNVKRVEYLRGLAHLHHAMREHGTRYGFILTEIELVLVRNGADRTPNFGYLEVTSIQLNAAADKDGAEDDADVPFTACLALWGLCMLAGDDADSDHNGNGNGGEAATPSWRAEIGAPAEGTRRKTLPRDDWMPQPQLAEKREAKRARGWVLPEDPVGRKELGKRGVRYGAC